MRTFAAVLLLAAAAMALSDADHWTQFKAKYEKTYSAKEEANRYEIFVANLRRAEQLTAADGSATYGVTRFSDLTSEEFLATWAGLNMTMTRQWTASMKPFPFTEKQKTVGTDWTDSPVLTSVKDQGSCGSCWAFSATAAAEGCAGNTYGKQTDLSPQQIMDCCTGSGCNGGCNGGMEYDALEWAVTKDLATLASYPYKSVKGTCKKVSTVGLHANTCDFYKIGKSEKEMVAGLEHSTVTVALDANTLQLYTGGVIKSCSGTQLNHALLLVADDAEGDAYKIKNSWGKSWGEKGFFRMVKNKGCLGIALDYHSVAY